MLSRLFYILKMKYLIPLQPSDAVSPSTAIYSLSRFSNRIQLDVIESSHVGTLCFLVSYQGVSLPAGSAELGTPDED